MEMCVRHPLTPTRPGLKTCERCREYFAVRNTPEVNRAKRQKRKAALGEWLRALKAKPCADCGEEFPSPEMDFHHLDPETKAGNVGQMVRSGYSKARIEAEIAKCVLLCEHCHMSGRHGKR